MSAWPFKSIKMASGPSVEKLEQQQNSNTYQLIKSPELHSLCSFYTAVRKESATKLVDGTGHRPHYSLRTLCRALRFAASNPCGSIQRSLYEVLIKSVLGGERIGPQGRGGGWEAGARFASALCLVRLAQSISYWSCPALSLPLNHL